MSIPSRCTAYFNKLGNLISRGCFFVSYPPQLFPYSIGHFPKSCSLGLDLTWKNLIGALGQSLPSSPPFNHLDWNVHITICLVVGCGSLSLLVAVLCAVILLFTCLFIKMFSCLLWSEMTGRKAWQVFNSLCKMTQQVHCAISYRSVNNLTNLQFCRRIFMGQAWKTRNFGSIILPKLPYTLNGTGHAKCNNNNGNSKGQS